MAYSRLRMRSLRRRRDVFFSSDLWDLLAAITITIVYRVFCDNWNYNSNDGRRREIEILLAYPTWKPGLNNGFENQKIKLRICIIQSKSYNFN